MHRAGLIPVSYTHLVEKQIIEVAPLAYMRGRTLDDSFIILDEAQNTTPEQMKMFLTRMGVGSKVVVTGDVTQIDLPDRTRSGLVDALQVLKGVGGIAQCYFTEKDVAVSYTHLDVYKRQRLPRPAAAWRYGGGDHPPGTEYCGDAVGDRDAAQRQDP